VGNIEKLHVGTIEVSGLGRRMVLKASFCRPKGWRPGGGQDYEPIPPVVACEYDNFSTSTPHNVRRYLQLTANCHPSPQSGLILNEARSAPLGRERIAKIMLETMQSAGIDTDNFKAHSTRSSTATKAFYLGIPLRNVLVRGGWKSEVSFRAWYCKELGLEPLLVSKKTLEDTIRLPWPQLFPQ